METLHALIDRAGRLPAEYGDALSSHLPMALHALHALGADAPRLEAGFTRWSRRFDGLPADTPAPPLADWRSARGDFLRFGALRAGFAQDLRRRGRDGVLREVLPALWPGVAAAAFHGLIRTAHAVQMAHDDELAAGLAYWAARWQPTAAAQPSAPALPFADWADTLEAAARTVVVDAALISSRMRLAESTEAHRRLAAGPTPEPDEQARLWRWAAGLYAETGNFTVLHLVTGVRAVGVLLPWVDDPGELRRCLWPAVTAAVLSSRPGLRRRRSAAAPDWPELIARAIASDDEHVVKLVHACVQAAATLGDDPFRQAAARALA